MIINDYYCTHTVITKGAFALNLTVGATHNVLNPASLTFAERQAQLEEQDKKDKEECEKAKKSPYDNWIQLNKDAYKAEDWLMAKSPIAYRIFKFLMNNMDGYNAVVCSYQVLQEYFDVSKPTITRAVKLLKERNYIDVHKSGTSNVYTVNKQIAWNSWGNHFKYAKFGANIIISESEQTAQIKTLRHKEVALME